MSRRSKRKKYYSPSRQELRSKDCEREIHDIASYIDDLIADGVETMIDEDDLDELSESDNFDYHGLKVSTIPQTNASPIIRKNAPIYVIDTNVLLECHNIIYDGDDSNWRPPENAYPILDDAILVIPQIVLKELDTMKTEPSARGNLARIVLNRLEKLFANSERSIDEILNLRNPIPTGLGDQRIAVLPLPKNFVKNLPYKPGNDDMDAWIIVTALMAKFIANGFVVGEDELSLSNFLSYTSTVNDDVTLLTNDCSMRIAAELYGVHSHDYSFTPQTPYTGCRELVVPAKMFRQFYEEECLKREDFERYLPNEQRLIANEYVIMTPRNDEYPRGYFASREAYRNIARYNAKNDCLYPLRYVRLEGVEPPNSGIATYYDAMNDKNIHTICVTGKAGTGKTYQAVIHAIKSVNEGKYRKAVVIYSGTARNPMGALPGGEDRKMAPMSAFVKDAIEAYLTETPEFKKKRELLKRYGDSDNESSNVDNGTRTHTRKDPRPGYPGNGSILRDEYLHNSLDGVSASDYAEPHNRKKNKSFYDNKSDNANERKTSYNELLKNQVDYIFNRYFMFVPYELVASRTFSDCIIIVDEAQRLTVDDSDTVLTRPGKNSLLIVCGDIGQIRGSTSEKRLNNGLTRARISCMLGRDGCAQIHLVENMRGDIADNMTEEHSSQELRTAYCRLGLL